MIAGSRNILSFAFLEDGKDSFQRGGDLGTLPSMRKASLLATTRRSSLSDVRLIRQWCIA
jgi:hypothetical protein